MNAAAVIASIQINLLRCPLMRVETVCDCLGKSRSDVNGMIENGELAFAFDLSDAASKRKTPRIFTLCVAEKTGWKNPSGQTKNYKLPEVISMILPPRDVRSVELRKIFACSSEHIYSVAGEFIITRKPAVNDGPESYTTFQRASVAAWLEKRRMI